MTEHRREEAEVRERRLRPEQERPAREDRFELIEAAQVDALDVRARRGADAVAAHVAAALALADSEALQRAGHGHARHHLVDDAAAQQQRVAAVAPAVVQRRPPQPLIGVVLDEPARERLERIARNHRGLRMLRLEPVDHRRGVGHPATVGKLDGGHLRRAGAPADLRAHERRHRHEPVRNLLVTEIALELAREVRDRGAVDEERRGRRHRLIPKRAGGGSPPRRARVDPVPRSRRRRRPWRRAGSSSARPRGRARRAPRDSTRAPRASRRRGRGVRAPRSSGGRRARRRARSPASDPVSMPSAKAARVKASSSSAARPRSRAHG